MLRGTQPRWKRSRYPPDFLHPAARRRRSSLDWRLPQDMTAFNYTCELSVHPTSGGRLRREWIGGFLGMNGVAETTSETSDELLLERIAGGDTESFGLFYDRHASLLLGVAVKVLDNPADGEDALQDALTQLWERSPRYDRSLGKPLSWAITLVRNKAIDRLRSRQRKAAVFQEMDQAPPDPAVSDPSPGHGTVIEETGHLIRRALETLPSDQPQAIELAFFGGLSHLEIAAQLSAPLGTIKARIRRGMLTLRDGLEGTL